MPARLLGGLSKPTATPWATWVCNVDASGSAVKVRSFQAAVNTLDDSGLPPCRLASWVLKAA